MQFTLTIQGNSYDELAALFERHPKLKSETTGEVADEEPARGSTAEEAANTAKEVEPEAPAKKPRQTRRDAAAKQDTPDTKSTPESSDGATATTAASPSSVTLDDIRTKASQLMDSGKASGKDIQEMLVTKFDARAFGAIKPEQYADVLGELNNLG